MLDKLTTIEAKFVYEEIKDKEDYLLASRDMKIAFGVSKCGYSSLEYRE